ncbi:breast carcinoma-amplified sequence 1 isoform X6 [Astatotilapia calliptera]|uniref:breast carcinoma-amplified sequence 1 isoform X6 n=1 Tax=Astatotilapia calliptera TaxID=8154 RepID=UPI000E409522|nr:breast carcinoma-amplified sequence 1 isoform X6 [Astatotilapia calliptera]
MGNEQSVNIEELSKNGTIPEKHENGTVNGISIEVTSGGLEINGKSETTVCQNGKAHSLNSAIKSTDVIVKSECQPDIAQAVSEVPDTKIQAVSEASDTKIQAVSEASDTKIQAVSEDPDTNTQKEEVKKSKGERGRRHFGKLFKKKTEPKAEAETVEEKEKETQSEDQVDVSVPPTEPQQETANLNHEPESLKEPERVTPVSSPKEENVPETDNGDSEPVESKEESNPEENPVMNFFKTLVAQISEPPAAPKGMSVPPPPPPEPPKVEIKGEPTAKPVKASAKEEPKAAGKEPVSSKGKSAKDTLSKFFRQKFEVLLGVKTSKSNGASASGAKAPGKTAAVETPVDVPAPVVEVQIQNEVEPQEAAAVGEEPVVEVQIKEEVPQPVVETETVDSSKAGTQEAAAKPEPPPPAQEEKKSASKSPFLSFFKPQVLLDHMTTKVQAASTSGARLLRKTTGLAAEPKKVTPTPPAAAEAAQAVKAKEEPKVAAKSSEQAADNKTASVPSQAGDDAASVPKKLEKRNSIQLFFKNLTQKRPSTDAGVQTEPLTAAQGAEKAK